MGCCQSANTHVESKKLPQQQPLYEVVMKQQKSQKLAIKLPNGVESLVYNASNKDFVKNDNIHDFINEIYDSTKHWKHWICYNDEVENSKKTSRGHCKGIVTWNHNKIGWLCHSVPKFPQNINSNGTVTPIGDGEKIYAQSFQYIEVEYSENTLQSIINQLHIMDAHIYLSNGYNNNIKKEKKHITTITTLELTDSITHIAKSPHHEIDIYSDYLASVIGGTWHVESWIRGHHINNNNESIIKKSHANIKDITAIRHGQVTYSEKQDHSKWAVSNHDLYWVGDLNRMMSQFTRGGGGFICRDVDICKALHNIIVK